jgi:hypothetical protein
MKTVQTISGDNFVLVTDNEKEIPISRPYLNHCDIEYREKKEEDYANYNLREHHQEHYGEGLFQGYDYGHDLGINDPFAEEILGSDILLR